MAQMKVMFFFIAIIAYMTMEIVAKPLENDGAEIVMKIEKVNEQLPGAQVKPNDNSDDDAKQKKSQRNVPVYYVNTKVNGKFGKSVRAFTSEEFFEKYPVKY